MGLVDNFAQICRRPPPHETLDAIHKNTIIFIQHLFESQG